MKGTMKLTSAEINHLWALLSENETEGTYTAPQSQYWARHSRIVSKLKTAMRDLCEKGET